MKREVLISVDVETDGPIPGDYSMSSLGACLVGDPTSGFYRELKPISRKFILEYINVAGLSRSHLFDCGIDAKVAMQQFAGWIKEVRGANGRPVFVAFNATFDWMFVHWYFEHFLGKDPFGISGWDIKAYYAGVAEKRFWAETSRERIDKEFIPESPHTHNALDDAREQAEIFQLLRRKAGVS